MRVVLLLAAAVVLIRDPTGKWANDPLQPWFQSLQSKNGMYCCARADGHPLDESEWDIKDNHYRVFVEGEWAVVPDDAVISGPNKFGKEFGSRITRTLHQVKYRPLPAYGALSQDRGFDRVTCVAAVREHLSATWVDSI